MRGRINIALGQLNLNTYRVLSSLYVLWKRCRQSKPFVDEIKNMYQLKNSLNDAGYYYFMTSLKKRKLITDILTSGGNWKSKFFFIGGN